MADEESEDCEEGWIDQCGAAPSRALHSYYYHYYSYDDCYYPARALRALGLLLADGTPTGGRGEDFLSRQPDFFTETAVTPERKVEKWFPRWEINRHVEG